MNVKKTPCIVMIAAAVGLLPPAVAVAEYATIRGIPVTEGQMRIAEPDLERLRRAVPEAAGRFVLKETRVEAEISGVLARVRVEQVFENPYPQRLEATYVFPLPEDAAVDRYWFQIDEQIIRGVVRKRHEARYEYERARDEGRKASLLEQERAVGHKCCRRCKRRWVASLVSKVAPATWSSSPTPWWATTIRSWAISVGRSFPT